MIPERRIEKYAFYTISGKEYYQYLPTSKLDDVIYVKGMKTVCERKFFMDGEYFIRINDKDNYVGVGESVSSSDIVRRYYEKDPFFQNYDTETIQYLKENFNNRWNLEGDGTVTLGSYDHYIKANYGEIPTFHNPHNIIEGETHWYLELYHEDGTVTYEKTTYDDKKYRGQTCEHYRLVRITEYELNGISKKAIIEREQELYSYHPVVQTELDNIIAQAKGLLSHQSSYTGFEGVSPLYGFNTEDSACVFHDKKNYINDQVVTTVTGSGDAILDLFLYGAKKIIAFDTNALTIFYGELKFIAAKYLSFEQFSKFFHTLNEDIYRLLEPYLSEKTRKFWNELYEYCKVVDKPLKDAENGGLFYPSMSIFSSNSTVYNKKGYYTEENYLKLKEKIADKTLEDIQFINCDLLNLPKTVDLGTSTYAYLSNIMDFMVGVDEEKVEIDKLQAFKDFIMKDFYPSLNSHAEIVLSYIKRSWHQGIERGYFEVYPPEEGFSITPLSNGSDDLLSFHSTSLVKEDVSRK